MAGLSGRPRLLTLRGAEGIDVLALAAGLVTVTAWASAFVGIRAAGHVLSPGSLALGRLVVSTVILGAVALVRRDPLPRGGDLVSIAIYGVLWLGIYSTTLNAAERLVDAGTAAMLVNTGPIIVAVLAGVYLKEGFPRSLFAGSAIAFAGAALIGLATTRSGAHAALGLLLCIVAAVAYSTAVVVQKPVLSRVPSFQVTWLGVVAATIALLPFAPGLVAEAAKAPPSALAWVLYLGAVPTSLGFATWAFALGRTSAGRMASLTYLSPAIAILLSWGLLGEVPPLLALAGGVLCIGGVYMARRKPARAVRSELKET